MSVSDPDVSRPRLIRDASFLEADRREIALRRDRHNANRELGRALKTEFVLQHMSEPQLRAKASDAPALACISAPIWSVPMLGGSQ